MAGEVDVAPIITIGSKVLKFKNTAFVFPKEENTVVIGERTYKTVKMPDGKTWFSNKIQT